MLSNDFISAIHLYHKIITREINYLIFIYFPQFRRYIYIYLPPRIRSLLVKINNNKIKLKKKILNANLLINLEK